MDTSKQMEVDRNALLYDSERLAQVMDETDTNTPAALKHAVKTTATIYEIRTALAYWKGDGQSFRTSDRIWSNCEAFENGEWELDARNNIVYGGGS